VVTATNPGIPNQNATGISPGSTGAIQNICFSKKLTHALFREQCELIFALLFLSTLFSILPKMGKKRAKRMMRQFEFSIKNQYNAFKSHHYHHLFFFDLFFFV